MAVQKYYCKWQGCKALLDTPGYCLKHKPLVEQREAERSKKRINNFKNAKRTNYLFYKTKEWRELRSKVLKKQKQCVLCGSSELLHVDHIVPPRGNRGLFFNINNLQVLCEICHRKKTAKEIKGQTKSKEEIKEWLKQYLKG
ncbi:HNH endonuclease [Treponema sp. OMZ 799]|uniref:HNH endonuclease n=1 Tax=Treponema sp. OMZ 799 TaxID=2563668 RepID=UPI0020A44C57|nr:HNH endonuclease [Treponema sp. OMZ 799]UTC78121.1 HNH endonuclease [Treponema sp. OMZ 799]